MTARHTRVEKSLDQNIRTWTCKLTRESAELVLGDLYCRLMTIKQVFHQVHNASLFCSFSRFDRIFLHYLNENDTSIIVHGNHHEQWLPQQIRKFFFIPLILVTFFQVRQTVLAMYHWWIYFLLPKQIKIAGFETSKTTMCLSKTYESSKFKDDKYWYVYQDHTHWLLYVFGLISEHQIAPVLVIIQHVPVRLHDTSDSKKGLCVIINTLVPFLMLSVTLSHHSANTSFFSFGNVALTQVFHVHWLYWRLLCR